MPSYFPFTTTTWWNCQDEQCHPPSKKGLSLKLGSPPQACRENHARQSQDQDSSSAMIVQSHQDVAATVETNYQDQCISSDSSLAVLRFFPQNKNYRSTGKDQVKPSFFLSNPSFVANPTQVDIQPYMAHIPYAYENPYVKGLYGAHGAQAIVHPQLVGIVPARLPLPFELAEDGPIYVNAKQYQGILRRRQIRARLEAQNKLLKNRKPYLHESRHLHAVKRVRGSGGRFLSTKKPLPSSPSTRAECGLGLGSVNEAETGKYEALTACSIKHITTNNDIYEQSDQRFTESFKW